MDMSTLTDIKPGEAVALVSGLAASSAGAASVHYCCFTCCRPATAPVAGFVATLLQLLRYNSLGRGQLLMS